VVQSSGLFFTKKVIFNDGDNTGNTRHQEVLAGI